MRGAPAARRVRLHRRACHQEDQRAARHDRFALRRRPTTPRTEPRAAACRRCALAALLRPRWSPRARDSRASRAARRLAAAAPPLAPACRGPVRLLEYSRERGGHSDSLFPRRNQMRCQGPILVCAREYFRCESGARVRADGAIEQLQRPALATGRVRLPPHTHALSLSLSLSLSFSLPLPPVRSAHAPQRLH